MEVLFSGAWRHLAALLAVFSAAVACGEFSASDADSACYTVIGSEIDIDCESGGGGSFTGTGLCVNKKHPACADVSRIVVQVGIDYGGDGTIDKSVFNANEKNPALPWYSANITGRFSPPAGGWPPGTVGVFHWEVYKEGQVSPALAGGDEAKFEH